MTNLPQQTYARLLGARILSEANDLKRTTAALANDLKREASDLEAILSGKAGVDAALALIEDMGKIYPIDHSDLRLLEDDCEHGVRIMRHTDSIQSSRIFDRPDRTGSLTPYYEYRDTAMSRLAPYRPEWIKELRKVDDADPANPDVIFNNGHFMHQYTLFVGPVNFYWGAKGRRQGSAMNTGDSFYVTPFEPHTFTTRSDNEEAYILAVTFGARVRSAQKELYPAGERALQWAFSGASRARSLALLDQHLNDAWMTRESLRSLLASNNSKITVESLVDGSGPFTHDETDSLAACLDLSPRDLDIESTAVDELVVIRRWQDADNRSIPGGHFHPMATTRHMPQMRGGVASIEASKPTAANTMVSSLHGWAYNFSNEPARLTWRDGEVECEKILEPGDSAYSQPFVPMTWSKAGTGTPKLCLIRIAGALGLDAQREFSNMQDPSRAIRETGCWFDVNR